MENARLSDDLTWASYPENWTHSTPLIKATHKTPAKGQIGRLTLPILMGENHNTVSERRGPQFSALDTNVYFHSPHDSQASSFTQNIILLGYTVLLLSCCKQKKLLHMSETTFSNLEKNDNISILSFSAIGWTRLTI